jgi:hypothetical protein
MLLNNGLTGHQAMQEIKGDLSDAQFIELTLFGQRILANLHHQGAIINIGPE